MRIRNKGIAVAAGFVLGLGVLSACGDAGSDDEGRDVEAKSDCEDKFEAGSKMEELSKAGKITVGVRSEEHTSELQSLMRSSYAVFCLKKKNKNESNKNK